MKTVLKIIAFFVAAVGIFFLAKTIIDSLSRSDDDKKRIAFLKGRLQFPLRKKNKKSDTVISDSLDDFGFGDEVEDDNLDVIMVDSASDIPVEVVSANEDKAPTEISEDSLDHIISEDDTEE